MPIDKNINAERIENKNMFIILESLKLKDDSNKSYINVENVLKPPRKPTIINNPNSNE